jgi:hypothetical protein
MVDLCGSSATRGQHVSTRARRLVCSDVLGLGDRTAVSPTQRQPVVDEREGAGPPPPPIHLALVCVTCGATACIVLTTAALAVAATTAALSMARCKPPLPPPHKHAFSTCFFFYVVTALACRSRLKTQKNRFKLASWLPWQGASF